MFLALFAMGVHSTFFGPIKYGILPQHLDEEEVLGGTGLVEAGTYIAILSGTIVGGIFDPPYWSALGVIVVALIGRVAAQFVPPAPAEDDAPTSRIDWHIVRNSWRLVSNTMHVPRLFLAIMAISFFWAIGAVLAAQFPPMVKNALGGDNTVATLFTAIFSVGVAIGSVVINHILKGKVSAKYAPASVIVMGLFVLALWWAVKGWVPVADSPLDPDTLLNFKEFWALQQGDLILVRLAWHRYCRGYVRRAALRLPDDHSREVGDRTHRCGEQHRQFRRDGDWRGLLWVAGDGRRVDCGYAVPDRRRLSGVSVDQLEAASWPAIRLSAFRR
jgi:hypothetical protein